MLDKKFDEELFIKTRGIREWDDRDSKFNRCESTPYKALEELGKYYRPEEEDSLVDFGCGKGRTLFYMHNKYNIPVSGVELNDHTFDDLYKNKESYLYAHGDLDAPIYLEYGYAENYNIDRKDNIFYFFNPFSVDIFKELVDNIIESLEEYPRTIDIILYYPLPSFRKHMKTLPNFKKINKIRIPNRKDPREKFIIYRYEK